MIRETNVDDSSNPTVHSNNDLVNNGGVVKNANVRKPHDAKPKVQVVCSAKT